MSSRSEEGHVLKSQSVTVEPRLRCLGMILGGPEPMNWRGKVTRRATIIKSHQQSLSSAKIQVEINSRLTDMLGSCRRLIFPRCLKHREVGEVADQLSKFWIKHELLNLFQHS